jgi:hypothetical protein
MVPYHTIAVHAMCGLSKLGGTCKRRTDSGPAVGRAKTLEKKKLFIGPLSIVGWYRKSERQPRTVLVSFQHSFLHSHACRPNKLRTCAWIFQEGYGPDRTPQWASLYHCFQFHYPLAETDLFTTIITEGRNSTNTTDCGRH